LFLSPWDRLHRNVRIRIDLSTAYALLVRRGECTDAISAAIVVQKSPLVPKQMSTGDRTILGRITKRGNGYLRTLFVQAARVILLRPASWPKHSFGVWLARAAQRPHRNVLAAALANKLARIAWTVLAQERNYEARVTKAAA
jgi:transposase